MQTSRSSRSEYDRYRQRRLAEQAGSAPAEPDRPAGPPDRSGRRKPRSRSAIALLRHFWHLLRGHQRRLVLAMLVASVSVILGLIPLYGTKLVVDNVLNDHPLPDRVPAWLPLPTDRHALLTTVAITMVALCLVAVVLHTWSRWQATRIAKRTMVHVRRVAFDRAVRLPLHRVYDLKSGGVASLLREDAGGTGELVFSLLYNPWLAIVQLLGSLIILASVDWRLLIGALMILPTVWLTHRTWINRIRPLYRDIRSTRQSIDSGATESFGGMRVVRTFSRQRSEAAQFTRRNHLMARQEIHAWWWARGVDAAWSILIPLSSAILLWYGGNRVLDDMARVQAGTISIHEALTTGDLVMFLGYLTALLVPIATLANSATTLQNNLAGLDRTLDLLAEPVEFPPSPNAVNVSEATARGHITLSNVSFHYAGSETPVLDDISLDVLPGQMVALVGPSGAGKTTLCNLVARFYDPSAGTITLDGRNLKDITIESYRQLLGIVEQDTFLFDGTIADNIRYGKRDATLNDVKEAARKANAHDFISAFENGYDTLIGERGVKLSGGQRQRITIARAILADPRILILDEATSNLDTESERLIQHSLHQLMRGRTTFVIAHRLSTIAGADRIVVLEDGRLVETGTHDELMSRSSRYREMVELQTRPPTEIELIAAQDVLDNDED